MKFGLQPCWCMCWFGHGVTGSERLIVESAHSFTNLTESSQHWAPRLMLKAQCRKMNSRVTAKGFRESLKLVNVNISYGAWCPHSLPSQTLLMSELLSVRWCSRTVKLILHLLQKVSGFRKSSDLNLWPPDMQYGAVLWGRPGLKQTTFPQLSHSENLTVWVR